MSDLLDVRLTEDALKFTINPLKCPISTCKHILRGAGRISSHLTDVHKQQQNKVRYFCPIEGCKYSGLPGTDRHFTSVKLLKQHYYKVHAEKIFQCEKCGMGFGMCNLKKNHQATCGMSFQCGECNLKYNSLLALTNHCQTKGHALPTVFTERNFKQNRCEERPLLLKEIPMEACSFTPAVSDEHSYSGSTTTLNGGTLKVTPLNSGIVIEETLEQNTQPPISASEIQTTSVTTELTSVQSGERMPSGKGQNSRLLSTIQNLGQISTSYAPNLTQDLTHNAQDQVQSAPVVQNIPALLMVNVTDKLPAQSVLSAPSLKPILPKPVITVIPIGQNCVPHGPGSGLKSCDVQTNTTGFHGDVVSAGIQTAISLPLKQKRHYHTVTGGTQTSGDFILRRAMESADLPVHMESVATQISGPLQEPIHKKHSVSCETQTSNTPIKRRRKQLNCGTDLSENPKWKNVSNSTPSFIPIVPNSSAPADRNHLYINGDSSGDGTCVRIYPRLSNRERVHDPVPPTDKAGIESLGYKGTRQETPHKLSNAQSGVQLSFYTPSERAPDCMAKDSGTTCTKQIGTSVLTNTPRVTESTDCNLGTVLSIPDSVIEEFTQTPSGHDKSSQMSQNIFQELFTPSHDIAIQTFDNNCTGSLYEVPSANISTQINLQPHSDSSSVSKPLLSSINIQTQTISESDMQTLISDDFIDNNRSQFSQEQLGTHIETQTNDNTDMYLTSSQTQTNMFSLFESNNNLADASTSMEAVPCDIQTQTASDDFLTNIQTQTVSDFDVLDLFMNSMETQTHSNSLFEDFSSQTHVCEEFSNQSTGTQTSLVVDSLRKPAEKDSYQFSIQTQTSNHQLDNLSISTQTFEDLYFDLPLANMKTLTANQDKECGERSSQSKALSPLVCNFNQSSEGTQTISALDLELDKIMNLATSQTQTPDVQPMSHIHTQTNFDGLDNLLLEMNNSH